MAASDLLNSIQSWEAALAADAANPQADYSIDGMSVSQSEWRSKLLENITNARKQYNMHVPYIQRTLKRM